MRKGRNLMEEATGCRSAGPASAPPGTCARSEQAVYRARGRARWRARRERLALAARAAKRVGGERP